MLHPEKNDVSISKLFNWGKEIEIRDINSREIIKCYLRLVGDADMNRARVYGLRKSAELRKKFRDLESDERVAFIADRSFVTKEELVKYILLLSNKDIIERAYKEIKVPFPKEPHSEAGLEAQEKYQNDVDHYSEKVQEAVNEFVNKELKKEEDKYTALGFDTLYLKYETKVVEDYCEREMLGAFRDYCVSCGVYKDKDYAEKLFNSVEDFKNLPSEIKNQIEVEYSSLEIDLDTLKKLPEAMPSPGFGV